MIRALKPDGSLYLICEVEYLSSGSNTKVNLMEDDEFLEDSDLHKENSVRNSLKEMFEMELFSDAVLKVRIV